MTEIMPPVHEWTLAWYDTLPEAYRMLDKNQIASQATAWDALTPDPEFLQGWGNWDVTTPLQTQTEIMASLTQDFQGLAGEPIFVQVWWAAPTIDGTLLQVIKVASGTTPEQEITVEPTTGLEGDTELLFYPTGDGKFTIRILILVPAPEGNLLSLRAVNVGPRRVTLAEMPVGGQILATKRPLLRYMDGIGRIAGEFRAISDNLWDGNFTNPATTPAKHLTWLAQMMGVPAQLRAQLPEERLREYMAEITAGGRIATGTTTAIAQAAKAFLTGDQMVNVIPHGTIPHTLIILVKAEEVPGGNLQGIIDTVRAAGVMPAGHDLVAREAVATWDDWELAAGTTWAELEATAATWVRADSLGINLEG